MNAALLVAFGGALGALIRYGVALLVGGPLGTLTVNVAGGFAIGLLAAALPLDLAWLRLFLMTGLLGGFTTFSAFSAETLGLIQRGQAGTAAAYVAASVLLALGACALGWTVAPRPTP